MPTTRAVRFASAFLLSIATLPVARAGDDAPPKGPPPVTDTAKPKHTNRLAKEKSPYLLQHAHNPVDWYPWGDEAFARARERDLPVFLSIGYSTCHWCHVMEHESFEDETVAAFLNEHFVCIKVDREERPDVDAVYMAAIQASGQGGGWPLSAFLTPEGKPFFLGTYFPPGDRYGRPGFTTLLHRLSEAWTGRRADVLAAGEEFTRAVAASSATPEPEELGAATLRTAVHQFSARFDSRRGGFGDAPKFPRAHAISFLLREAARTGDAEPGEMAATTLAAMARGGMYDHVGGGFHRYSTDGDWLVPHFEKMLYDQSLLATALVEAHLLTGDASFAVTARETLDYMLRDLRDAGGAFHAAEDADSEGVEGLFYLWTTAQLREVLGDAEGAFTARLHGATEKGNFTGEAEPAPPGSNILHLPVSLAEAAAREKTTEAELRARLDAAHGKLLAVRAKRVRPHLDDKVLTGWNGLAISALARAGRALDEPRYLAAAGEAADFVLTRVRDRKGRLLRRWRDGEAAMAATLEDHAFLARGLLDLYEATGDTARLRTSLDLAREMTTLFGDEGGGALWSTAHDAEALIARTREGEDWATPSGNSAAAAVLLRLSLLTGDVPLGKAARDAMTAWSGRVARIPMGFPALLEALQTDLGPAREIVLAGDPASEGFRALRRAVDSRFLPFAVTAVRADGDAALPGLVPFAGGMGPVDGKPAVYLCSGGTCRAPLVDPAALGKALDTR